MASLCQIYFPFGNIYSTVFGPVSPESFLTAQKSRGPGSDRSSGPIRHGRIPGSRCPPGSLKFRLPVLPGWPASTMDILISHEKKCVYHETYGSGKRYHRAHSDGGGQ